MKTMRLLFLSLLFLHTAGLAQWSSNPNTNLAIVDTTGEQAVSKIAMRADGGCYVTWFDSRSGSYAVYMQYLDVHGNKMWPAKGLLISANPQNTSLVDHDLEVDSEGNAIAAFTDIRDGNLRPYIYKISPTGQFLWGANGLSLTTGTMFQANPKIAVLDNGNIAICWIVAQAPNKLGIHLISSAGVKLWGAEPVLLQDGGGAGYNYPDIVPSDSGRFIVLHTTTTGNFPAQTVKLRAQKISVTGSVLWTTPIQDLGRIAAFSVPKVISDKSGGGIIAWHDDRDNNSIQVAYVQRVKRDGTLGFEANGFEMASVPANNQFNPVIAFNPLTEDIYSFWLETNSTQNQHGITGQRVSSAGVRGFGASGKIFIPLSAPNTVGLSSLNATQHQGRGFCFYLQGNAGGVNNSVEGFAVNAAGDFVWTNNFLNVSAVTPSKLQMVSGVDPLGNSVLVWGDTRNGNADIYGQSISAGGLLGMPAVPVEITVYNATTTGNTVILYWETATETNNMEYRIERRYTGEPWEEIGTVQGSGTVTSAYSYTFTDIPREGKIRYRLKQIDYDGSYQYFPELEVDFNGPLQFNLSQNFPNPFNPSTRIQFSIAEDSRVDIVIYDILGREVMHPLSENKTKGVYNIDIDVVGLSAGIYFYELRAGSNRVMKKMTLLK